MQGICNPISDKADCKVGWHDITQEQYDSIKLQLEKFVSNNS